MSDPLTTVLLGLAIIAGIALLLVVAAVLRLVLRGHRRIRGLLIAGAGCGGFALGVFAPSIGQPPLEKAAIACLLAGACAFFFAELTDPSRAHDYPAGQAS